MSNSEAEQAAVDGYVDLLIKQTQEDRAFARMRQARPAGNRLTRMAGEALWKAEQALSSGDLTAARRQASDLHDASGALLDDLRARF